MSEKNMLETTNLKVLLLPGEVRLFIGDPSMMNAPIYFKNPEKLIQHINGFKFLVDGEFTDIQNFVNENWKSEDIYTSTDTELDLGVFKVILRDKIYFKPKNDGTSLYESPFELLEDLSSKYSLENIEITRMFLENNWPITQKTKVDLPKFGDLTNVIERLVKELKPQFDKEVLEGIDFNEVFSRAKDAIPRSQLWEDRVKCWRNDVYDLLLNEITDELTKVVIDNVDGYPEDTASIDTLKINFYQGGVK